MGTEEVVYLPIKLAQALQDALFSHPGAGSVPVPASLLTLVMEELRKTPWSENERTLLRRQREKTGRPTPRCHRKASMNIYFDTEFIDTGKEIHLLSIGMVRHDGLTYYAEPDDAPKHLACEWVQKNVLTHLAGPVKPREQIKDDIIGFAGANPIFWAYFASYDWLCLCQLFGRMLDVPAHWPNFVMDLQQWRVMNNVRDLPKQTSTEHHALNDAKWTKEAWLYVQRDATRPRLAGSRL